MKHARKFDGELCKDPLMCLTLPFWEPYWPELRRVVFCLRHPLPVAQSIVTRYWIPLELGFEVWRTYVSRFFNAATRTRVFIFDFDVFRQSPKTALTNLLEWLGRPIAKHDIQQCLDGFFHDDYIHWSSDTIGNEEIPVHINALYQEIQSRAEAWR